MVEAIANSAEDYLSSGIDFKISPSASYITDRKSVTFFYQWQPKLYFWARGSSYTSSN